jgi:DNA-binding NarL/FixJ family response regulator
MRVLLADDQPEVRSALRLLLEQEPGAFEIREAADVLQLKEQARSFAPDLILLDWELPGLQPRNAQNGHRLARSIALLASLRQCCPGTRIVALSGRSEARQDALACHVDVFVSKSDPPEVLLEALNPCTE